MAWTQSDQTDSENNYEKESDVVSGLWPWKWHLVLPACENQLLFPLHFSEKEGEGFASPHEV